MRKREDQGLFRGIEVEACALAEFPVAGGTGDAGITGAGVRHHECEAQLGGKPLGTGLDRERLCRAGQPCKEPHHGHRSGFSRWRHEHGKTHGAARLRHMRVKALDAAEAALFGHGLDRRHRFPLHQPDRQV
ncbi:MAG: hypothetical protein PW735_06115 [Acidobacteriaceae bacterium]|nr:hypothetical protein [Acidobacteriaceae bacterium]